MKRILVVLAIVVASMSYSATVFSEENSTGVPNDYGQIDTHDINGKKDECLILAKNCIGDNETVMQRVERLKREIEKGIDVYTPEELKILQDQLNWINTDSAEYSGDKY